jgi:hypothetical protein
MEDNHFERDEMSHRPMRTKKNTMDNFMISEVQAATKHSKKKKTSYKSSHSGNGKFVVFQSKRPRGRPPLNKATVPIAPSVMLAVDGSVKLLPHAKAASGTRAAFSIPTSNNPKSSNVAASDSNHVESVKMIRPPVAAATRSVIAKLMTSDPLTGVDIAKSLSDTPKDLILSILDVLQVMGIVVQYKPPKESRTSASEHSSPSPYFALAGFARALSAIDITKIESETLKCLQTKADIDLRNNELQVSLDC